LCCSLPQIPCAQRETTSIQLKEFTMFATGFTVFLAMMLLLAKLKRRWALRMLHHDLVLDVSVSLIGVDLFSVSKVPVYVRTSLI